MTIKLDKTQYNLLCEILDDISDAKVEECLHNGYGDGTFNLSIYVHKELDGYTYKSAASKLLNAIYENESKV